MKRAICALLVLLPLNVVAQRVVSPSFFGMHVKSAAVMAKMPIKFGTIGPMPGSAWKWLEPKPGQFNWNGYDAWVRAANAGGYDIIYTFIRTPPWAGPGQNLPPSDLNSTAACEAPAHGNGDCMFKSFVYTLVSRYKGKIKYYQLWNEPNASGYWSGTPAELAHMARDAYGIVHEVDKDARVLLPATSPSGYPKMHDQWLTEYLRAGGAEAADIGAWHGYLQATNYAAPWPEHAESASDGCALGTWRCPGSVIDTYKQVRAVMDANGMAGKELWDTEGGFGVNDDKHHDLDDSTDQAAWLARWYIVQAGLGVGRAVWYMYDAPDGWGTMWDQSAGLYPSGIAYQQVYSWLVGASISPCVKNQKVWSCNLTRPGGYEARIVWMDGGGGSYSAPPQFGTVRDLTGGTQAIKGGTVSVDKAPVLLEKAPAS